ncbi:MAG: AMP-dependent synthetase, partial [Armatimonadota bacterium]|nr:AMP-dependent synthetase [Armatimonadota bacterium]
MTSHTPDPAGIWTPTPGYIADTNVAWLMHRAGVDCYEDLHRWSVQNREAYWAAAIERLGVRFRNSYDRVLDLSAGVESPHWLPGAKLNIVESCFSAPLESPAITYQTEDGALGTVSVGELKSLTAKVAAGLVQRGFKPGDALAILM